jgi:hypothetical protein
MDSHDDEAYEKLEKEIWQPMHAEAIKQGKLLAWHMYKFVTPDNGKRDYDYLVVNVYPNWDALENAYSSYGDIRAKVHTHMSGDEIQRRTEGARSFVKTERWIRRDFVGDPNKSLKDVKYVVIDWMDVQNGRFGDYFDMESEVYKPVHQVRVDAGNIASWSLMSKMGYSELPGVDAATSATYSSWSDMWNSYPEGAWKKAHPDKDPEKLSMEKMKNRIMVGSDIMKLITYEEAEMD